MKKKLSWNLNRILLYKIGTCELLDILYFSWIYHIYEILRDILQLLRSLSLNLTDYINLFKAPLRKNRFEKVLLFWGLKKEHKWQMQQCYLHFNHSNRLNNFIFMSVFSSSVYFNGCTASCQQNECVPEHLFSANWGFETMSLKMFSKIKYLKWDIRWKEPARMFHFIRRNIKLILRSNCNEFFASK